MQERNLTAALRQQKRKLERAEPIAASLNPENLASEVKSTPLYIRQPCGHLAGRYHCFPEPGMSQGHHRQCETFLRSKIYKTFLPLADYGKN